MTTLVAEGYCQCGCGSKVSIVKETNLAQGYIKGEPVRYVRGHYMKHISRPPEERFWEKVAIAGEDDCWLWTASVDGHNYGQFWSGKKLMRAHTFSFELKNGSAPKGLFVLHTCDNTLCVNPKHLFAGTQRDNMLDMMAKGRRYQPDVSGEKNGRYKHGRDVGKSKVKK